VNVLIVNAFGRSNRGDAVLLDECLAEIEGMYAEARITVAVYEGIDQARFTYPELRWTERIGNSGGSKAKTVLRMLLAWLATVPGLGSLERFLPDLQRQTLRAFREADLIVSAPGGYIHDTNFAYIVALFHIMIGTRLKKRVVLAPQSVGPIDRPMARWLTRKVLSRIPYICARESYSYQFLTRELGLPPGHIYKTGDSAFWNFNVEQDQSLVGARLSDIGLRPDEKIFGMTVVGWNFPKSDDPSASYERYVDAIASIADYVAKEHGLRPVVFNQVSEDLPTARLVRERATSPIYVDERDHEPWVLRALLQRSVVFLGTRFHSCIFSLMAGRPTFAVAYLPKTEHILNDLGLASRHTSIDSIDVRRLLNQLTADINDPDRAEREIDEATKAYRREFKRLGDVLRIVGSRSE
jgi:colanic acid/amylovoran biosynthesis protein